MRRTQRIKSLISRIQSIGEDAQDPDELRLRKRIFVSALFLVMIATTIWGSTYLFFGEVVVGSISLLYSIFNLVSLLVIRRTHKIHALIISQMILGLIVPSSHSFMLGGFAASSAVMLWSIISPFAALIYFESKQAAIWSAAYLCLLGIDGLLQKKLPPS
jgi:hypothetical protein